MRILKSKWSQWEDISTGGVHEHIYLVQARRHKSGKVQFRVAKSPPAWACATPTVEMLGLIKEPK